MTPEQLQALRDSLTEFSAAEAPAPPLREYCRHYGIEFGTLQPAPQYRAGTVRSGPYTLMAHRWLRPGASRNLLLVHGYFDHSGLYGKLVEYGLSRNCNVLIFDLPGHGLSSGEAAVIDDFGQYGRAIADVLAAVRMPPLPLWVMAQSTGCAALVEYARGHAWPFSKAVLMAPLVRPVGWFRVRAAHAVIHRFVDSVAREFSRNSSDRQFLALVQSDPLQARRISLRWVGALRRWLASLPVQDLGVGPSLVLQGDADTTVAWRYNLRIIEKLFPGSRIEPLAGAGHHLANEADEFRQRYYRLVDRYLGIDPVRRPPP